MTTRISRDDYGLALAAAAALRADCTRRQVGAVIVAADGSIVSTGYNGRASGLPGCLSAGACPRGQMAYPEPPVQVGQPDPTDGPFVRETDYCGKTVWVGTTCWTCTQDIGEHLWHIAGDGEEVCHVWTDAPTQPADVSYEATGCDAAHAEANAIIRAGRDRCVGATIYVTDEPCHGCQVLIAAAGLARVVTPSLSTLHGQDGSAYALGTATAPSGTGTATGLPAPSASNAGAGPPAPDLMAALRRSVERHSVRTETP